MVQRDEILRQGTRRAPVVGVDAPSAGLAVMIDQHVWKLALADRVYARPSGRALSSSRAAARIRSRNPGQTRAGAVIGLGDRHARHADAVGDGGQCGGTTGVGDE